METPQTQRLIDRLEKVRALARKYKDERDTCMFIKARSLIIKINQLLDE